MQLTPEEEKKLSGKTSRENTSFYPNPLKQWTWVIVLEAHKTLNHSTRLENTENRLIHFPEKERICTKILISNIVFSGVFEKRVHTILTIKLTGMETIKLEVLLGRILLFFSHRTQLTCGNSWPVWLFAICSIKTSGLLRSHKDRKVSTDGKKIQLHWPIK